MFDKTGTITIGQPLVTDVVGEARVLTLAASLLSGYPLAQAVLSQAEEKVWCYPCGKLPSD